jgi:hypothetical protein
MVAISTKRLPHISLVKACPHCGGESGYYIKLKVTGIAREARGFDGELGDNTHMHDELSYATASDNCYCVDCGEILAKGAK